ncbi:MAG: hypothetical protein AAF439_01310 [Pseudomonadota bacterium]
MRVIVGLCLLAIGLLMLFIGLWISMEVNPPTGAGWTALFVGSICTIGGIMLMRRRQDEGD